jgi:hypothetical protein
MLAGSQQEETSDDAYSRINPPYPKMTENRSGKAARSGAEQNSNDKRIADFVQLTD